MLLIVLPVLLGQRRASSSKRMSLSTLIERAWILKMCVRPWNTKAPGVRLQRPVEQLHTQMVCCLRANSWECVSRWAVMIHLQIRQAELDLPVQTSRSHEGRVQGVWSVGGHQHFDVATWVEAVQLVDELQHSPLDLVVSTSAVVKTSTCQVQNCCQYLMTEEKQQRGWCTAAN